MFYEVPKVYIRFVDSIETIGRSHYKVTLKSGYCYKENGVHKYIVERYALFSSFRDIVSCSCNECIYSGAIHNHVVI